MKKYIAWILLAMMLFSAVGCGKSATSTVTKEQEQIAVEGTRQMLVAMERIFDGTHTATNSETGETYQQRTEAIIYPVVHSFTDDSGIYSIYLTATFEAVEIKNEERMSVWGYGVYEARLMMMKSEDGSGYQLLDFACADVDSLNYAEEFNTVCGGNVVVEEEFKTVNLEESWTALEGLVAEYKKTVKYTVE